MASGWVKSLQSKSRASDDVFNPDSKHLLPSSSCRKTSSKIIKDVIIETKTQHHPINQNQQKLKPEHVSTTPSLSRSTRNSDLVFPAVAELPEGHPSRDYPSHELPCFLIIYKIFNSPETETESTENRPNQDQHALVALGD
ncbi:C2H2-LIKE ZINC FINGER PROTEIN [Salix purpurea]|uniref:C2H2-LIKE ZINC FINGER PROTEIN n=1 Tax=Salix purpurea TaxID=77065 RepID=A0A9Q0PAL0_SALPP|nr:C2H2-LIKE ZINC FINGER PROTEIN [Salix purpurea]